jgi:hypothetical protein
LSAPGGYGRDASKVILDAKKLEENVRRAIGHAHDAEEQ